MNFQRPTSGFSRLFLAVFSSACLIVLPSSAIASDVAPHGSGSVALSGSTLVFTGTELNDRVTVSDISGDRVLARINGKNHKFPAADVSEIQFIGNEGDDVFINYSEAPAVAFGGDGDDYLKTFDGQAVFYGGTGDDFLLGSDFADVLCGGSDDDIIFGFDGNDLISGDAIGVGGGGGGGGTGGTDVDAQFFGSGAFARGMFVQIGVNEQGTFGTDNSSVPSGFVDTAAEDRSGFGLFGFIADSGMDGYEDGGYDGDFFTPGSPEEGFGVQIDGTNFNNNTGDGSFGQIPGMLTSASVGTSGDIEWVGEVAGLEVARKISVFEQGLFIRIEATLTNRSGGALNDIFYLNNVDPDNDQTLHGDFSTFNAIVSQGDEAADNLSLVTAQQTETGAGMSGGTEETGSALSLVSFDPRGRVAFGGFSNRDAEAVYNATGFEGMVGASSTNDEAIALAFDVGTLASGESTTLVYFYSLDPTGIDTTGITDNENACADDGLAGDDIVYGGNGDDDIDTDAGKDIVYGGSGDDVIDSGLDADYVYGQSGDDEILSGRGNDRVFGGPGNDIVDSSRGVDHVYGENGDDEISSGPGHDKVFGGSGNDFINAQAGDDRVYGGSGDDTVFGGNGNDFIDGGSDEDYLAGHAGDDRIFGGAGDDSLFGGPGDDDINGGGGNDHENQ